LEAIRTGAKDYIIKPFERERVVGAIRKLLGLL
jgi:response regulator of citrate/malate metabolism